LPFESTTKCFSPTSSPTSGLLTSGCGLGTSQTISAYQYPSARRTRWQVLGVPSNGWCSLIFKRPPIFLGTHKYLPSKRTSLPHCLSWIECQRFGVLNRGKPTGCPSSFRARNLRSALSSLSASVWTTVAGATCPRPLNALVSAYLNKKAASLAVLLLGAS